MYAQLEKPKENNSLEVANSVAQKKSNVKQGFGFVDNRSEAVTQKNMREIAISQSNDSIQRQEFPIIPKREYDSKLFPSMQRMPVQRLQIQHGLTAAAYNGVLRNSVLARASLIMPGVGNAQNNAASGPAGHAEEQLIAWATGLLPILIPAGTLFEIWVSSSPCSSGFGTSALPPGCMERLQAFAVATGIDIIVHADKPYQPRGAGMKANSVAAAGALAAGGGVNPPIPIDFCRNNGISAGLAQYPVAAGAGHMLEPAHGTVAQLSGDATSEQKKKKMAIDEEGELHTSDFATKPGTVKLVYGA